MDALNTRSGFVALAGRPNVGKSTLVNAMVGAKVAIVSDKPQTTRRAIRGVATRDDVQIVLTDLPGVQRPRDELTRRMQHRVEQELGEADAALFVLNGDQGVGGPGDVWIAEALRGARVPVVIAVNKVDRTSNPRTVAALQAAADLGLDADVFPVSARTGHGVAALNAEHRGVDGPTDVLSFPVDGAGEIVPPAQRELGDVVICPEHTEDLTEAVVHGMLHLVGMDHETDEGEMLALQAEVVSWIR